MKAHQEMLTNLGRSKAELEQEYKMVETQKSWNIFLAGSLITCNIFSAWKHFSECKSRNDEVELEKGNIGWRYAKFARLNFEDEDVYLFIYLASSFNFNGRHTVTV